MLWVHTEQGCQAQAALLASSQAQLETSTTERKANMSVLGGVVYRQRDAWLIMTNIFE